MQVGDIFTIDDNAIAELEKAGQSVEWAVGKGKDKKMFRLKTGMQFRIAKDGTKLLPTEVRASRLDSDSGKAIRGRPRKFPGQIVADLLGESLDDLSAAPVASPAAPAVVTSVVNAQTAADDSNDVEPIIETEQSDEERAASEEKVKAIFGMLPDSDDDNW